MKALKRLGSFLLALVMVLSMIPATHTHAAEVTSGYCGDPGTNGGKDVSWTFQDGVLTISGTGKTQTYASANKNLGSVASIDYTPARPWTAKSITKAVVEEGVTKIGGVFYNAYNMTEVSLPDSLTVIGDCSFEDCIGLESITIPKNVTDIWVYAFGGCENLTSITFTGDAPSFDVDVFKGVTATCYYPTSANWPADTLKDYGGSLTWAAYDPCAGGHSFGEDDACTVCGKSNKHNHGETVYTLWNSPAELPGSAGHYALEHDIVLTQSWTAPAGETVLCLNGHSISGNFTKTVGSGSTLTLCDCADTPGTVSAASSSTLNSFLVETGGVLNISPVQITVSSGKAFSDSSVNVTAVRNNGGTVHMDSGEIRAEIGDWASEGAYVHGICNVSGTVHISGGTLYAYAQSHGAGTGIRYEAYCLNNSGTANITGGTFTAELGADTGPTNKYAYAISNSFSETSRVNLGGNPQLSGEVCMQRHNTYSAKVGDLPYTGAALQFTWRPYSSMRSYDIVVRDVTQDNQHLFTMADAAGVSMDLAHVGNHLVYDNGQPHTHTWTGDCEAVRVCSVCEYSDGVTPGHDWLDATCTAPKTCSVCGETEGETTNHSYDGGVCTACGNVQKAVTITSAGGKQTEYDTLEEAVKAAADGDTITLNAHVKIKKALTFSSGNITLDLNKHMLDVAEGCLYDVPIVNIQGATLTITGSNVVWDDSSEDHNHTVNDASCNVSVFSGKLILDHAKVYACCKEYAIVVHAGASAELKGADCSKVKIYGTVTVTDSTVSYLYTSEGTAYVESGKCYLFNAGTAYIRGGTVTGALNYNNCLMEISGGTVSGIENYGHMVIQDDAVITDKMLVTVSGTAAISGGTFTGGIALSQNYKKLSDLLEEGYVYYDGTSAYGPTHPLLATQELTGDPDITVIPAEDTIVASRTDPDGTVTNYVSVEEALLAGTEGTVTLLADATLGYNVSVGITENLDLNGKKLTVPEDHTLKVYGILMMNGGSVSGAYSFGTNSGGLGGSCGENAWWKLEQGVLTIYGSGEMTSAPWPKENITTTIIEEGITSICEGAFKDCEKMTAVTIPNTVTKLGSSCFDGCEMLASVDLPEGITAIPSSAFAYCWALTGIEIPESVTSIGYKAFAYCREMVGMQLPEKVTSIGSDAFTGCNKLKFVRFNGNAPTLGSYAFRSLTLKAFYPGYDTTWTADVRKPYGGSVTWVAYDQNHLEHSFDSNGVCSCGCIGSTCGQNALWALDPATGTLYISGTGKMEDFYSSSQTPWANYKNSVRKVVVEEGITHVGGCAFKEFSNLETVSLPDSLTSIGSEAIMLCPKLKEIKIPENVTKIGVYAFEQCYGLESVVLPEGLSTISSGLFNTCISLKSVTIPASVTAIGTSAFNGCNSLADVYYGSNEKAWNQISIGSYNNPLLSATIHYTDPCLQGHTWKNADCAAPKTCTVCGETEGETLGHSWVDADCVNPKTCTVCGETEGEALGHDWVDADCITAKT